MSRLIWNFIVKPVIVMNITKRIIFYTSQLHVVSICTYIYSCILMPHAMSGFQGQYHKVSPAEMHSNYLYILQRLSGLNIWQECISIFAMYMCLNCVEYIYVYMHIQILHKNLIYSHWMLRLKLLEFW